MSELTQLLISSLIKQKMQEPQLQREREERAAELARQREFGLLQSAVENGANESQVWKLQSLTPNIPPNEFEGFATLAGIRAKKAKEAEQVSQLTDPQQLAQLGVRAAPTAGPRGELVQPDPATSTVGTDLAQRIAGLNQAGRPDLIPSLMARIGGAREASTLDTREKLAGEQRAEATGIRAERRAEATNIRSEGRTDFRSQRNQLESAEAQYIAYAKSGIVNGDTSIEASAERLRRAGMPDAVARSSAYRAEQIARGMLPDILEKRGSVEGKSARQQNFETRKQILLDEFPHLANDPKLDHYANAIENQQGLRDPYSSSVDGTFVFIPTQGEKDHGRVVAQREALIDVKEGIDLLQNSYDAAVEARNDPARRGEFTGGPMQTDTLFDVLAKFGEGPGEIANLRTAAIRYAFAEAKSTQGAKASDIDFAKNMLYVPATNEVGTELGAAKMRQLHQVLTARVNAPYSPETRRKLTAVNQKYRGATASLNAVAAAAAEEIEKTGAISAPTQKRLDAEIAKFQRSPVAAAMRRDLAEAGITSEHAGEGASGAEIGDKF